MGVVRVMFFLQFLDVVVLELLGDSRGILSCCANASEFLLISCCLW